jgi:hypothetical protein
MSNPESPPFIRAILDSFPDVARRQTVPVNRGIQTGKKFGCSVSGRYAPPETTSIQFNARLPRNFHAALRSS